MVISLKNNDFKPYNAEQRDKSWLDTYLNVNKMMKYFDDYVPNTYLQYYFPHFISNSLEAFMFEIDSIELLGYVATFFVAASFLFKSIVSLRTVNCIGAILFVVYGLLKGSYPVALLNIFLVLVNVYQLWRLKKKSTLVSVK